MGYTSIRVFTEFTSQTPKLFKVSTTLDAFVIIIHFPHPGIVPVVLFWSIIVHFVPCLTLYRFTIQVNTHARSCRLNKKLPTWKMSKWYFMWFESWTTARKTRTSISVWWPPRTCRTFRLLDTTILTVPQYHVEQCSYENHAWYWGFLRVLVLLYSCLRQSPSLGWKVKCCAYVVSVLSCNWYDFLDILQSNALSVTTSWKRMPTTKTQDLNFVQETSKSSNKPKSKAHRPSEMSSTMIGSFWNVDNWTFVQKTNTTEWSGTTTLGRGTGGQDNPSLSVTPSTLKQNKVSSSQKYYKSKVE
jgi:hypothetical protein